jgi:enoyl-CoA hydratase/carnithine racemase
MTDAELLFEVRGAVAWLTLNREARRNAITLEMIDLMNNALDQIEANDNVRAVCLTGAGEKAFCAGADLGMSAQSTGPLADAKKYAQLLQRLLNFPRPILARINGHCLAGGMGLMLAADIVYASEGIKIGTPEAKVGLFPLMIGALIFDNALRKKVCELFYTAELIAPEQAESMGLITRVYPRAQLDSAVNRTLDAICANAPLALRRGRLALAKAATMELPAALDFLSEQLGELLKTNDAAEGLTAFIQKRPPVWTGR